MVTRVDTWHNGLSYLQPNMMTAVPGVQVGSTVEVVVFGVEE